jgi:NAD(P)-dependent dehydrogenase (short-subunit alcohol dehydrogenase family)
MNLELDNKTALVTGSHRGTGQIIAKTLLDEGAQVLVHGMTMSQAQASVEELGSGFAVAGDIITAAGCKELLDACAIHTVDILINNYGAADPSRWQSEDQTIREAEEDPWIVAYQKNVLSAQRLIAGLLPQLIANGWGRIINLGTVGSTSPNSRNPGYYSAKGALATMTVSLAKEVAGSGVRVNLVSPGMIATPEVQEGYMQRGLAQGWGKNWQEIEAHVAKDIPIKRISRREEVAGLVAFLCGPQADAIHGQNIKIEGGQLGTVS